MQNLEDINVRKIGSGLATALLEQRCNFNGNKFRPVYGRVFKSELKGDYLAELTKEKVDGRQVQILDGIGDVKPDREVSLNTIHKIRLKSLVGGRGMYYKHSYQLTFAMEELLEMKEKLGGSVAHAVMHLDSTFTAPKRASKRLFMQLKQTVARKLKKALGDRSCGFFVFERDKQNSFLTSSEYDGLHIHVVFYYPGRISKTLRSGIRREFEKIMESTNNNALVVSTSTSITVLDEHDKPQKVSTELDMCLADYLCKELDKPIVTGTGNFSSFNMGKKISLRRNWRARQCKAIDAEAEKIAQDERFGLTVGDINSRLTNAASSVNKPVGLA